MCINLDFKKYPPLRKWMFTAIAVAPFDLVSASLCRKLANFSTESCFKPCNLDLVVGKYAPLLFPTSNSEKKSTPYISDQHQ
jgi:hypothetical protein